MDTENNILKQVAYAVRRGIFAVGLFSFFINLLMLALPVYTLQVFDRVLMSRSTDTLLYLTLITIFVLLIMALLIFARSHILIKLSMWLEKRLGLEALERSPDEVLAGKNYPKHVLKDVSTLRQSMSSQAVIAIFDIPWVPIYLAVIFVLDPVLGLIATAGAILLFVITLANEYFTRRHLAAANHIQQHNQYRVQLSLRNSESIQAMGMQEPMVDNWFHENNKMLERQQVASVRSALFTSGTKFLRFVLQIMMLGAGAYLVIQDQITPGMMIAGTIILARALQPVEQLNGAWSQWMHARQAYQRLYEFLSQKPARKSAMTLPRPSGYLLVDNISYTPDNMTKRVIDRVSFTVMPGEILAVIGASASGKTTLAHLLVGAYTPKHGVVRLSGADVYHRERSEVGQHIGYLPQSVELFPGTIQDNISRLHDANSEDIIAAAELAGVHRMILSLPDGYETDLSDPKVQLSGGQQQRIGLARALYGNPSLIVLDEPNSSLDQVGELALHKALQAEKKRGAAIVVITHRLEIIDMVDKILVLGQGKVKEFGKKEDVMEKFWQKQQTNKAPDEKK